MERFSRQLLVLGLGVQERLSTLKVTVVGCGALGSKLVEELVRLGVGNIKVIDADIVELSNLHRVSLFDEDDVGKPKAKVCVEKAKKINKEVNLSYVLDVIDQENVEEMVKGSDFVFDALDTPLYRLILNDACVKLGIPMIYGGVNSWYGSAKLVTSSSSCLSCFMSSDSQEDVCEVTGTLGIVVSMVTSIQVGLMLKALESPDDRLFYVDGRDLQVKAFKIERRADCPTCSRREFPYLKHKFTPTCGIVRINERGNGNFTVLRNSETIICHENGKCFKKLKS